MPMTSPSIIKTNFSKFITYITGKTRPPDVAYNYVITVYCSEFNIVIENGQICEELEISLQL
jgi:hypothetical protein